MENIGYVIPVDVVHHFITDFDKNGKFTSFPMLGIEWQKMESPYMRKAMGMKARLLRPSVIFVQNCIHLIISDADLVRVRFQLCRFACSVEDEIK